jgi:endonuclease VIII-like 1
MPELAELKIMADFVNAKSKGRTYNAAYDVAKGNIPSKSGVPDGDFNVKAESFGKELVISLYHDVAQTDVHVFMGMSGNWKFVPTESWNDTRFVRLRLDTTDGHSLLLYGSYMGPKYKIGPFATKRGPDPTKYFDRFKENVLANLAKKAFDRPICEALLEQKYFNGIGNYLRSTILYYLGENPFEKARDVIQRRPDILEMCRDVPLQAYRYNGGQLRDWHNPNGGDAKDFTDWVFYQKGLGVRDNTGRTFWFDERWIEHCPY